MPIYEYRCQDCNHELEAMQRISADALTTCPECGEEGLKRLISQTSFVLKGSGWYATDYGGKTSAPPGGADKDGGGESAASDSPSKSSASGDSSSTSGGEKSSSGATAASSSD